MASPFTCTGRENGDEHGWHDYAFVDTSPKSVRRLWVLSVSTQGEGSYAMLRRSDTDDGEFDHDVNLPKKMVEHLTTVALAHTGGTL